MINKEYYKSCFDEIMKENGVHQYQLAEEIGVSIATIKRFKGSLGGDDYNPSKKIIDRIDNYIINNNPFFLESNKEMDKVVKPKTKVYKVLLFGVIVMTTVYLIF